MSKTHINHKLLAKSKLIYLLNNIVLFLNEAFYSQESFGGELTI
jgi:hypothetical protein